MRLTYWFNSANYKKEGENGNEDGRKGGSFSRWNIFVEDNKHTTFFFQKNILGKRI